MGNQWYEELFDNYAGSYDRESYTQGTKGEVDFIAAELSNDQSKTILDIGCGTGRHAIELASRGYRVTGIDLSPAQIARGREKAAAAGVCVDFQIKDARNLDFREVFDAAIMLCEGGFPLMETDEMNHRILEHASRALRPGGKLIFSTLNALYALIHSLEEFINASSNGIQSTDHSFDWLTLRDHSTISFTDDSGKKRSVRCNERYYVPSEISWYLKNLNFKNIGIYGCRVGCFSREIPLTCEDFEMLVVAEK